MKLLSQTEAKTLKKKENDSLIESNLRLKQTETTLKRRLHGIKSNYEPEKLEAWKNYQIFVDDINKKKSQLLKELKDIEKHIDDKKEIYYGLIEKQDFLEEKLYEMTEQEKKLDLRESFVKDLENKWDQKNK